MKSNIKHLLLTVFMLFSFACFASPTVQDVENAIRQNNAPLVEQMSKQVLAELINC